MTALLERAVTSQMVSDVPVGAFLSGGVDSSAIVAFAARTVPNMPCFTMRFASGNTAAEGFDDDLPYARRVAAALGTKLIEVPVGAGLADELEAMTYQLDEPQADLAPLNVGRVAEAARASGIKVLLSGAGGDDLYGGYRRHQAAMAEKYWAWLPRSIRGGLRGASGHLPSRRPLGRRIAKAFSNADLDRDERLVGYYDWIGVGPRRALYTAEVRAALDARAYEPMLEALRGLAPDTHTLNRALYLDGRYFLVDHNLNYTDKMAMAHGVEVRVPLIATELVRFAASLPIHDKVRGRTTKWILREAIRGLVPDEVLTRSKTGFGVPLRTWMQHELVPMIDDVLSRDTLRRRGFFNPDAVLRLVEDDRAGRIDAAYPILALVCTELWCREFVDRAHGLA